MSDPVVIAKFLFPYQAEFARIALEAEGIPCTLLDGNQTAIGSTLFPVRLMVMPEDEAEAREILATLEEQRAADEPEP
jgi:hypothetical protein